MTMMIVRLVKLFLAHAIQQVRVLRVVAVAPLAAQQERAEVLVAVLQQEHPAVAVAVLQQEQAVVLVAEVILLRMQLLILLQQVL